LAEELFSLLFEEQDLAFYICSWSAYHVWY